MIGFGGEVGSVQDGRDEFGRTVGSKQMGGEVLPEIGLGLGQVCPAFHAIGVQKLGVQLGEFCRGILVLQVGAHDVMEANGLSDCIVMEEQREAS